MEKNENDMWTVSVVLSTDDTVLNTCHVLFQGYSDQADPTLKAPQEELPQSSVPAVVRVARGHLLYQRMMQAPNIDPTYGENPEVSVEDGAVSSQNTKRLLSFDVENAWLVRVHPEEPEARFGRRIIGVSKDALVVLGDEVIPFSEPGTEPPTGSLEWGDLAKVADKAFEVFWLDDKAVTWAEKMWAHITNAGLAGYDFEIQRVQVIMRFLALAHLYQEWCGHVLEEGDPGFMDHLAEWNEDLGISPFYIGQLISPDFVADYDEDEVAAAMRELVLDERKLLVSLLKQALGGDAGLFISMWRIHSSDDEESDANIVSANITVDKHVGYEWISSDCLVIW